MSGSDCNIERAFAARPNEDGELVPGDGTLHEPGRYLLVCFIPTRADPDQVMAAMKAAPADPALAWAQMPKSGFSAISQQATSSPNTSTLATGCGSPISNSSPAPYRSRNPAINSG